jgi:hypothetical protein
LGTETLNKSYAYAVFRCGCCKSEHRGSKKTNGNRGSKKTNGRWDSASLGLGAKDFKSNYAKEQLRENMGQREPKERGFKQGFKEDFRSSNNQE